MTNVYIKCWKCKKNRLCYQEALKDGIWVKVCKECYDEAKDRRWAWASMWMVEISENPPDVRMPT
jgi:hypothetical protein